ncbi:MAG: hypothetical protein AAFR84_06065 [Pseudomonadota bacterium]
MPTPPPPPADTAGEDRNPAGKTGTDRGFADGQGTRPALHFDWREWLPYLDAADAPEGQKREMIETLWAIILTFVDLGWEVTDAPANAQAKTCGQHLDLTAALRAAVVNSDKRAEDSSDRRPAPDDTGKEHAA